MRLVISQNRRLLVTTTPASTTPPTLRDALRGDVPTFIVHRGHRYADEIPGLLREARAVAGSDAAIGVAIRLPRAKPVKNRDFLSKCASATLKIADPEIYTMTGSNCAPEASLTRIAQDFAYAQVDAPDEPDDDWIQLVLDAQRDAGVNVYMSASGWVASDTGRTRLDKQLEFVAATRDILGPDEPMFVNLTVDGPWLRNSALRAELLEAIVESSERLWWVRVRWPSLSPSNYVQLTDVEMLAGYAELSRTAQLESKTLMLPNSSLTGWVATALGASGFSTGMSANEQSYTVSRGFGRQPGQPAPPRTERFFDQNLLHVLVRSDYLAIQGAGLADHTRCRCTHCDGMTRRGWSMPSAALHYLRNVAELTAELGQTGRQATARDLVDAAKNLVAAVPAGAALTGQSDPRHLAAWAQLLA